MHLDLGTILALTSLIAALVLLVQKTDRTFPTVAVIAAGIQTAMAFGVMSVTLAKLRVDVILPALLVVAGAVCWGKSSTKGGITAATTLAVLGGLELILVLRLFA